MATGEKSQQSMVRELFELWQEKTYKGIVPYIAKDTGVKVKEFEQSSLADKYWLDTSTCKIDKKIKK